MVLPKNKGGLSGGLRSATRVLNIVDIFCIVPLPQDNPDDGLVATEPIEDVWQHCRSGGRGPVPGEDWHHHHLEHTTDMRVMKFNVSPVSQEVAVEAKNPAEPAPKLVEGLKAAGQVGPHGAGGCPLARGDPSTTVVC